MEAKLDDLKERASMSLGCAGISSYQNESGWEVSYPINVKEVCWVAKVNLHTDWCRTVCNSYPNNLDCLHLSQPHFDYSIWNNDKMK